MVRLRCPDRSLCHARRHPRAAARRIRQARATHAIPNDPAIATSAVAEWQAHLAAGRIGIVPPGRSAEREAHYLQIDRITGKQG